MRKSKLSNVSGAPARSGRLRLEWGKIRWVLAAATVTMKCFRSCWRDTAARDLLGLGITALIAGFMSGMAGNVSAFATVWTYDIYRPLIRKNATDAHYVAMGRWCTIDRRPGEHRDGLPGDAVSQHHGLCAGAVQLFHRAAVRHRVAGHVVETGHADRRLLGTAVGYCLAIGMWAWVKSRSRRLRYVALSPHAKDMAENMYRALWSWMVCVVVTVVVSLVTKPKPDEQLVGLVYGCTKIPSEGDMPLYQRPIFWAGVVAVVFVILNIIFW